MGNIEIGDNVLNGTYFVILPGLKIGRNAVIAARSLVNKDVEANMIVGGFPARHIKNIPT